ncbi:beta-lactamase family protein [Adhaeribacter arboris]|nr:beta-lactamase family protein [Adhaeribacter arboris]
MRLIIAIAPSPESFGHSGFTGTFTWMDPKYDLVYVFLSEPYISQP